MQTDFLQFIFQAINNLLTQNLGFFDAMGQNLFRMFATILIVWYGVKSALAAAGGKSPFHFDNFATLLLTISFGFAMVNYYSTPIPGIGTSFHNLVTDEAQFLASRIDQAQLQTVVARVADFESRIDSPGVADFLGTIIYAIVMILLAAAQAIAIVVIAYGFIATAVCVLVGPVFIPFFIVPKLEWLFWGWFKCLHPIRVLPRHCFGRGVRDWQPHPGNSWTATHRSDFNCSAHWFVPGPLYYVPRRHLRPSEDRQARETRLESPG